MKKILLTCLMLVFVLKAWTQDRTVSGKVTDASTKEGLPGVNVVLQGTTRGVSTDLEGNYMISVPSEGGTLVFSFIGMEEQQVAIGGRSVIDVQLQNDIQQLNEVVVNGLGSRLNARNVTYGNQTVQSDELLTSPNKNALEALRGKTAGVKITSGSGSIGSSNRIVLRGEASLTGNNNALIVVDGVPIDNSASIGGAGGGEAGYADFGNRFNDFDPDNIESITVLKGPSATSLYGSRGASGVLVITTKSGSKKGLRVNINSTSSVEQAYVILERQDKWGQGYILPDGTKVRDSGENWSWGPEFDGVVRPWTSPVDADGDGDYEWLSRPYLPVEDQIEDFFRNGYTFKNNFSLSGGDEKYQYFASYGNTEQSGILENTDYTRHSFTANANANFTEQVTSSLNLSYSNVDQNTAQEGSRAFEGQNPYAAAIQAPNTIPYDHLRNYNSPFHGFEGYYGSYTTNPYFILNEFVNNGKIDNFLASLSVNYSPIENLSISTRIGTNYVSLNRKVITPQYEYLPHFVWGENLELSERGNRQTSEGSVQELIENTMTIDWTSTVDYTRTVADDFEVTGTVGLNYYDISRRQLSGETVGGLVVPEVYNLGNSRERAIVNQNHLDRRIVGLFANLNVGWQENIFLNYSARNDWSSTLPEDNRSFFYQALGANAILSSLVDMSATPLEYVKLRASYGTTGKDAEPYLLNSTFNVNPTFVDFGDVYQITAPFNGQTGISTGGLIGNNSLQPELTTSFEVGTDFELFRGRIAGAYTYYFNEHSDQIVISELARTSGYSATPVNVGEVTNEGHEVTLNLIPIRTAGFTWMLDLTWSKNISEVVKISDQTDELVIYNSGRGVTLVAQEGQPFGVWKAQVRQYTDEGQLIVNSQGLPEYTEDVRPIGSVQPDWIGGLVNTFQYRGASLGFVIDVRQGSEIFSLTKSSTQFNGTALTTDINNRENFVIENSVVRNEDGTFSENTTPVDVFNYINDGNAGRDVIDGSFVKLREITLGYDLPSSWLNPINLQSVSVQLFAQNVKFWLPDENTFADPEVNGPSSITTNVTGVETTQTPTSRSYGINLNITL